MAIGHDGTISIASKHIGGLVAQLTEEKNCYCHHHYTQIVISDTYPTNITVMKALSLDVCHVTKGGYTYTLKPNERNSLLSVLESASSFRSVLQSFCGAKYSERISLLFVLNDFAPFPSVVNIKRSVLKEMLLFVQYFKQ
ncbi:hypothetical protein AVEN_99185-1 [Araneus ventricosus]|uniref:Uncharacterized protein n=1 Tax=Araneus ventricosus TaxID=182803 RepID=A0A4Y2CL15_ARAVE|nr:hypothetical protein AVEN_99185-1 [Araneus ventricosus]